MLSGKSMETIVFLVGIFSFSQKNIVQHVLYEDG